MADFDLDTRVEGGAGSYSATLSPDWEIWGPSGGYVASVALRAAGREAEIARPACFSGHFLRVARFAPVALEVEVLQRGRRSESLRVGLRQDGRRVFEALVRTALDGPGLAHDPPAAPAVPAPEDIPDTTDWSDRHRFWSNFDTRWVKPGADPPGGRPAAPPHWISWHRIHVAAPTADPWLEAARSLLLIDTLGWPAASLPHPESGFIAPNLDVVAWFHRGAPESAWLLAEAHSPNAGAGLVATAGRVWSRDGALLASGGGQLYCTPRPD